ncbi:helix-turn-helix transcriptional regulator [Streptomyces sp. NPDC048389]|uniref:helix-turn-helix transcriptional regulator n=1 Tax=Streptomyces sp. NPDC048389 TaxID=3154622 RepID=UPI003451859D
MEGPRDTAGQAFARKLSELRAASGRTYGSLSRRTGVGASTLHRYCSGRTLPMEFAPVERLARLCGCRGDDLVALHRLWVLADAERSSRRQLGTRDGTTSAEGAAIHDAGTTSPGAAEARVPAAGAERAPAAEKAPAQDAETEGARGQDADAGTARAHNSDAEGAQAPDSGAEATGGARTSHAEDIGTAGGAGGGAARGAAGTAARDDPAGPRPGETEAEMAAEAGTGRAGRGAVTGASALSRCGRRRAYAAAFGAAVVTLALLLGFGGFTTPGTEREPSPNPPAEAAPFTWVTDDHVWRNGCGHTYIVRRGPARVPAPPPAADAEQWARSLDAEHGAETQVRITLQGSGRQAVVLESLHVRVTTRRAPQERPVYRMDAGCGGSLTPRLFDVDLDRPRPVARPEAGNDAGVPIPAVSFPYRISATDPEVLLVSGRTVTCDCDWYLELRWSGGGRTGTVRIDDNGRPFRTSAPGGGPVYEYDYGSRRWVSSLPTSRRP